MIFQGCFTVALNFINSNSFYLGIASLFIICIGSIHISVLLQMKHLFQKFWESSLQHVSAAQLRKLKI